eukprot:TRINITY_DN8459_c0_g1_i5.p1 TRINITY_DN8459_c0_g1~~TRINITY_DN8459_c0_g1_i5.p1  ORF type:complete len:210 (-),score=13.37 TRINITY_DN8459_c0_g1_i5:217-846(-)
MTSVEVSHRTLQGILQQWIKATDMMIHFYKDFHTKIPFIVPNWSPFAEMGKDLKTATKEIQEQLHWQKDELEILVQNSKYWDETFDFVKVYLRSFETTRKRFDHYRTKIPTLLRRKETASNSVQLAKIEQRLARNFQKLEVAKAEFDSQTSNADSIENKMLKMDSDIMVPVLISVITYEFFTSHFGLGDSDSKRDIKSISEITYEIQGL